DHADKSDWQRTTRQVSDKSLRHRRRYTVNSHRTSRLRTLHHHIRSNNSDFNRKTTARVDDTANLPIAQQRVSDAAKLMTGSFSERQFVKRADVEGVTHVEVVVAAIRFEVVRNRRGSCFIRAGCVAETT